MPPSDEAIRKALAAVDVADLDDQIERSSPALGPGRIVKIERDNAKAIRRALGLLASFPISGKEVMPHSRVPELDTTPPQPSEAGVTGQEPALVTMLTIAPIIARAEAERKALIASGDETVLVGEFGLTMLISVAAEAATEISRLRTTEAEQAARIAELEVGLRRLHQYARWHITEGFWHHPTLPSAVAEAARLLPQEGK